MEKLSVGNFAVPMVPLAWDPGRGFRFEHLKTGLSPKRSVLPPDLQRLRAQVVAEKEAEGRALFDGRTVELAAFDIGFVEQDGEKMTLDLIFREGSYFNNFPTHFALDRLIQGVTVRQRYAPDFGALQTAEGYEQTALPMMVGVSCVLITEDNQVLLTVRSRRGIAVAAGLHHVSLAEGMRPEDLDMGGAPNPFLAIVRGMREEVGVDLDAEDIVITALGMSQQYLQPDFACVAITSKTAEQVVTELPAKARDRWENDLVFFSEWSPVAIAPLLFERQWSPHASFSLLMGLLHEFGYERTAKELR